VAHYTKAAGFPSVPLVAGMKIRIRALSPTTDVAASGVTVTQFAIYGRDKSPGKPLEDPIPEYVPGLVGEGGY
jgi:hypothetical protein